MPTPKRRTSPPIAARNWSSDARRVAEHLREAEATFNRCFAAQRKMPFEVRVSFEAYYRKGGIDYSTMRAFFEGDGRLYPATIETVVDLVACLLNGHDIGVHGLVQTSKTATQDISSKIHPVISYLKNGIHVLSMTLVPTKSEHLGQFKDKSREIDFVLRKAVFQVRERGSKKWSKSLSVDEYCQARNDLVQAAALDEASGYDERTRTLIFQRIIDCMGPTDQSLILTIGGSENRLSNFEIIRLLVRVAKQRNLMFVMYRDEAHWGMQGDSLQDRLMGMPIDPDDLPNFDNRKPVSEAVRQDKTLYELLRSSNVNFRWVGCSATNWHSLNLEPVFVRLTEDYCGLDYYLGHRFTSFAQAGIVIREPRCHSLRDLDKLANTHLADYTPADLRECSDHTLRVFAKDLAKAIRALYAKFGSRPTHQQVLARLVCKNAVTEKVRHILRRELPDIKILAFYNQDDPTKQVPIRNIRELLRIEKVGPNDKAVILATARARMGDSLPASCGLGIDLTYESVNLQAILQGILGRLCGYHKDPDVFLSDANMEKIERYKRKKGDLAPKELSPLLGGKLGRKKIRLTYGPDAGGGAAGAAQMQDPVVRRIFKRVESRVCRRKNEEGRYLWRYGEDAPFKADDLLISPDEFAYLSAHLAEHQPHLRLPKGVYLIPFGGAPDARGETWEWNNGTGGSPAGVPISLRDLFSKSFGRGNGTKASENRAKRRPHKSDLERSRSFMVVAEYPVHCEKCGNEMKYVEPHLCPGAPDCKSEEGSGPGQGSKFLKHYVCDCGAPPLHVRYHGASGQHPTRLREFRLLIGFSEESLSSLNRIGAAANTVIYNLIEGTDGLGEED